MVDEKTDKEKEVKPNMWFFVPACLLFLFMIVTNVTMAFLVDKVAVSVIVYWMSWFHIAVIPCFMLFVLSFIKRSK